MFADCRNCREVPIASFRGDGRHVCLSAGAHGLCFSVTKGRADPAVAGQHLRRAPRRPRHRAPGPRQPRGWARQGVLLLNTTLTVRAGQAASHQGKGWETFTDEVIRAVDAKHHRVVFILWGSHARRKKALIDTSRHIVHRVGAPVAALGPQRLLRQPAVLPGQRRPRGGRPRPDRLEVGPVSQQQERWWWDLAGRTGGARRRARPGQGRPRARTPAEAAAEGWREQPRGPRGARGRTRTRSGRVATRTARAGRPRRRLADRAGGPNHSCRPRPRPSPRALAELARPGDLLLLVGRPRRRARRRSPRASAAASASTSRSPAPPSPSPASTRAPARGSTTSTCTGSRRWPRCSTSTCPSCSTTRPSCSSSGATRSPPPCRPTTSRSRLDLGDGDDDRVARAAPGRPVVGRAGSRPSAPPSLRGPTRSEAAPC